MNWSVLIDTPQNRISRDRISTTVSGAVINDSRPGAAYVPGWAGPSENTYVDPARSILMLTPAPRMAQWQLNASHPCQRYTASDLTKTGTWIETDLGRFSGDVAMHSITAGGALTTPALLKNQGVYLAIYNYQGTTTPNQAAGAASAGVYCEGLFSASAGQPATSFRWYYDRGQLEVFRGPDLSATYNLIGDDQPQQGALRYVDLLVIPCGPREALFLTNAGKGAYHAFTESEVGDNFEVTGAGAFEFSQPTGQVTVQIAPMRFASSGYMCAYPTIFSTAPPTGTLFSVDGFWTATSLGGGGSAILRQPDNGSNFVPNGVDRKCKVRVSLTAAGSNTGTLFVSAVQLYSPPESVALDGPSVDVLEQVTDCSFTVGQDPSGDSISLELVDPAAIAALGVPNPDTGINRSAQIKLGEEVIFDLRLGAPRKVEGFSESVTRLAFEGKTLWAHLESYRFQDDIILDGKTITAATEFILEQCGLLAENYEVSSDPFTLPAGAAPSLGDYAISIKAGDTPAEWLLRIRDDFAATWSLFIKGPKLYFRKPEDFPASPVVTLGKSAAALGGETSTLWRDLIRESEVQVIEPEANDIWVWGFDPRTQKAICVHYADSASQDPTISPLDRPANWLGEIRRYALFDPAITTKQAAIRACGYLARRLTVERYVRDITCEFIESAWKNDLVEIEGENWRIQSFSGGIQKATEGRGPTLAECQYVLERDGVTSGANLPARGRTAEQVAKANALSLGGVVAVVRPGGDGLGKLPRQTLIELASPSDEVGTEF